MEISFDCTQCGRCCHYLRLTLSVDEARTWAANGHQVDLLAEAWAWTGEEDETDPAIQWRKATTFAAMVGEVPFRINLRLVARHEGPCPHLLPDMRCGNYEARPRICRIYPLESRPFEAMTPDKRRCPPEAWSRDLPVLTRDSEPADAQSAAIIADHRQAMIDDVPAKARLAATLDFTEAALAGEGLAICEPSPPHCWPRCPYPNRPEPPPARTGPSSPTAKPPAPCWPIWIAPCGWWQRVTGSCRPLRMKGRAAAHTKPTSRIAPPYPSRNSSC